MLEDIRYTLEKARTALTNGWTKGEFFNRDSDLNQNDQGFSVCLAGGVLAALDMMEEDEEGLMKSASGRGAIEALYTHIPWRSRARRAAEKELLAHASTEEHADPIAAVMFLMRQWALNYYEYRSKHPIHFEGFNPTREHYEDFYQSVSENIFLPDHGEGECKQCYFTMIGAITSWNDLNSRKKNEVLDLVDASIKDVIRKSEII